jgi:hypothetical protein
LKVSKLLQSGPHSPPSEPTATTSSPAVRAWPGRQASDGEGDWAHPWSMGGGGLTGGVAGERRWRRTGGGAAAGARIPVRTGGAGQRVARVASRGPRERTEAVGWLRDRAGS